MKELNDNQISSVSGGAEHGTAEVGGGIRGALGGAAVGAIYFGLATNPAGWVVLGIIGVGALAGAGLAHLQEK